MGIAEHDFTTTNRSKSAQIFLMPWCGRLFSQRKIRRMILRAKVCFGLMQFVSINKTSRSEGWDYLFNPERQNDADDFTRAGLKPFSAADWRSIQVFFSRTWFRRLWIVQEVIMAKDVMVICDSTVLPWSDISNFVGRVWSRGSAVSLMSTNSNETSGRQ
jgi:hypothetical protein